MLTNKLLRRDFLIEAIKMALLVSLVAYIVPTGGLIKGLYDFPWRLANQLALALLFCGWLLLKLRKRQGPTKTSVDWIIAAWFGLTLITTFLSVDRRLSWEMVAYVGAHVLWYYVALDLFRREKLLNDTVAAVAVVGTVIAALGILEFGFGYLIGLWSPSSHRIRSALLNPNILGAFLCLAFGFTLYHISSVRSTIAKRGWVAALMLIIAAILLTRSRGAWLNLAAVLGTLVSLRLTLDGNAAKRDRRLWRLGVGIAAVVVALLFLVVLSNREVTNAVRLATWRAAIRMITERPWQGFGPGTYGRMLLAYRDPHELTELHAHAHSAPLTIMAEMGVVSGFMLGIGILLWGREVFRRLKAASLDSDRWQRIVALATVVGFLVHSQVESFVQYPMYIFLIMILIARLTYRDGEVHRSRLGLLFPSVTLLVVGVVVIRTMPAYGIYYQARMASERQNLEQTVEHLTRAIAADPDFLFYRRQLAITQGVLALERRPVTAKDYAGFDNAFRFSDYFAPDHAYLACLGYWAGDLPTAITEMERARSLDPQNLHYMFNLGMYYETAGQLDRAQEQYIKVIAEAPSVLRAEFWRDAPERRAMLPTLAQRALSTLPQDDYARRGDILADAEEWESAKMYYALQVRTDDPAPGWVGLARIALANGDIDAVVEHTEWVLSQNPRNPQALFVRAQAHLAKGDVGTAADELKAVNRFGAWPEVLFFSGEVARIRGDQATAERLYLSAISQSMTRWHQSDTAMYALLIGRRLRLATEDVHCLDWPYPSEALSLPVERLRTFYVDRGDQQALQALQKMLPYSMR